MIAKQSQQYSLGLTHPDDHFDTVHVEIKGTVVLMEIGADGRPRHTKIAPGTKNKAEILETLRGLPDVFFTPNQFKGWRRVDLLQRLNAVYVDLDGCTDFAGAIHLLAEARMPAPSLVVYSGRGMHFYWLLESTPATALPVWQQITNRLIEVMTPMGADHKAKDCARVLRLVGSENSKSETTVKGLILSTDRWTMHQLADEVLGPRRRPQRGQVMDLFTEAAKSGRTAPRAISGSIYQRWYLVFQDLIHIAQACGGRIPAGSRDAWLFLYAVAMSWFATATTLEDGITAAAKQFTDLSAKEVAQIVKTICQRAEAAAAGETITWDGIEVDPRYRFRRSTLFKWLRPLIPDSMIPSLRAIIPDDVARDRKLTNDREKARQRYGYEDTYTGQGVKKSNEEKRATARLMRDQGMTQMAIATELGVSQQTIARWLSDLYSQNRLV